MTWTWWMTLAVILAVLLLIGCIPVGVDAAYGEGGIRLAVKIWLFRLQLLPQKPKKKKIGRAHRLVLEANTTTATFFTSRFTMKGDVTSVQLLIKSVSIWCSLRS